VLGRAGVSHALEEVVTHLMESALVDVPLNLLLDVFDHQFLHLQLLDPLLVFLVPLQLLRSLLCLRGNFRLDWSFGLRKVVLYDQVGRVLDSLARVPTRHAVSLGRQHRPSRGRPRVLGRLNPLARRYPLLRLELEVLSGDLPLLEGGLLLVSEVLRLQLVAGFDI